jgi:predicted nucleotidyltransferase
MTLDQIRRTIRENKKILEKYQVESLQIFGSAARQEMRAQSDLDFVVRFKKKSFDHYMGLKQDLEKLFGCHVDLVLPESLKPRIRRHIESELQDAA